MNIDPSLRATLQAFRDVSIKEPDSLGLVLTLSDTIVYHRGVKTKTMPMDITVEYEDGLICFYGPGKAIEMMLTIEELRAIMRLFDVPQDKE